LPSKSNFSHFVLLSILFNKIIAREYNKPKDQSSESVRLLLTGVIVDYLVWEDFFLSKNTDK